MPHDEAGSGAWRRFDPSGVSGDAPRRTMGAELEAELDAALASDLPAREHMLDLIRLGRAGELPSPDVELCAITSMLLAEIASWLSEHDPEREL